MDLLNALLLWIHFGALAVGGAATFGMPVVGAQMAGAAPEGRASLVKAMMVFRKMGGIALGLLILTGLALLWSRYGGTGGLSVWFWVKMVLVVGFVLLVILGRRNAAKAIAGDRAAAARQPKFAVASGVTLLAIVLCAVLTFD